MTFLPTAHALTRAGAALGAFTYLYKYQEYISDPERIPLLRGGAAISGFAGSTMGFIISLFCDKLSDDDANGFPFWWASTILGVSNAVIIWTEKGGNMITLPYVVAAGAMIGDGLSTYIFKNKVQGYDIQEILSKMAKEYLTTEIPPLVGAIGGIWAGGKVLDIVEGVEAMTLTRLPYLAKIGAMFSFPLGAYIGIQSVTYVASWVSAEELDTTWLTVGASVGAIIESIPSHPTAEPVTHGIIGALVGSWVDYAIGLV